VADGSSATRAAKNPASLTGRTFGVDTGVLRTSLLVIGPPGSGKTESIARPIVRSLVELRRAGRGSVVVFDPKGTDFAGGDAFDHTIDLRGGGSGFHLFGGAESAEEGADRLAAALLPQESRDTAYFVDSAKNALYSIVAPFHAAHDGRWPTIRQMLDMLADSKGSTWQSVRDRLRHRGILDEYRHELGVRTRQAAGPTDAAASLVERLGLLNRPHLRRLIDETQPRFAMRDIDRAPCAVRIVLSEAQSPDAVRILARLAISQFVQVATAPTKDRELFTALVCDEASRFLDEYVVTGVRQVRSNNAGMVLLTQSIADIPLALRDSLFGAVGGKAVFAGLGPEDAELLSGYWGTRWERDVAITAGAAESRSREIGLGEIFFGWERPPDRGTRTETGSTTVRQVERPLWSPSEIINDVPPRHCIVSLATADGRRSPPVLVNVDRTALPPALT
jgi:type IV secretory pathway TraG/TraD family ATPase VirD4